MNIYPLLYKVRDLGRAAARPINNRLQLFYYDAFHRPITCVKEDNDRIRLNLLVMSIEEEALFAGISTAIKIFSECYRDMNVEARIITLHTPHNYKSDLLKDFVEDKSGRLSIFVAEIDGRNPLPVRRNDFFFSSFWVTALLEDKIYAQQKQFFPDIDIPYFYLCQDYEPGFYPWSSNFLEADSSYFTEQKIVLIVNSKELYDYFSQVLHYSFYDSVYFSPILNERLREIVLSTDPKSIRREKQLLIYGRPGEARNAFETTVSIVKQWSSALTKEEAAAWSVVSLGAKHIDIRLRKNMKIISKGMVPLDEYASYMLQSYAGISLMVSPHPSYPPLEMSTFGMKTITNTFANKDLTGFNQNLTCLDHFSVEKAASTLLALTRDFQPGMIDTSSSYVLGGE